MRVAVLGAAGRVGAEVVRDLAASPEVSDLTALDLHQGSTAGGLPIAAVDAQDRQALALALGGSDLLVNAAGARVNVAAMDAALMAPCSYLDLGGRYHVTAQQLALDGAFAAAGLVAILGCGAGPGLTNLLAQWAAEELHELHTLRCASAGGHASPEQPPMALRSGTPVALRPRLDGGRVRFAQPVGERPTTFALSCEALTLGASLGVRDVDVRLALLPPSDQRASAQLGEATGTDADGAWWAVTAHAVTHDAAPSAAVAAAVVRLLARGALLDPSGFGPLTGVLPPERAVPREKLFPELEARGCSFSITRKGLEP